MKKIISLLLSIMMVFSLVACGGASTAPATPAAEAPAVAHEKKNPDKNVTFLVTSDIHGGVEDGFTLAGVVEKRKEYEENPELVDKILEEGTKRAKAKAEDQMKSIKRAMKIDY